MLDVLALAGGFVLRAVAGAVVVERAHLPLALRLHPAAGPLPGPGQAPPGARPARGAAERREPTARPWRSTRVPLLDQLLQVVTTSLLVAYMLYTFFAENLPRNRAMMLTIPFVLYGLFRYLYLVHARGEGGSPRRSSCATAPWPSASCCGSRPQRRSCTSFREAEARCKAQSPAGARRPPGSPTASPGTRAPSRCSSGGCSRTPHNRPAGSTIRAPAPGRTRSTCTPTPATPRTASAPPAPCSTPPCAGASPASPSPTTTPSDGALQAMALVERQPAALPGSDRSSPARR